MRYDDPHFFQMLTKRNRKVQTIAGSQMCRIPGAVITRQGRLICFCKKVSQLAAIDRWTIPPALKLRRRRDYVICVLPNKRLKSTWNNSRPSKQLIFSLSFRSESLTGIHGSFGHDPGTLQLLLPVTVSRDFSLFPVNTRVIRYIYHSEFRISAKFIYGWTDKSNFLQPELYNCVSIFDAYQQCLPGCSTQEYFGNYLPLRSETIKSLALVLEVEKHCLSRLGHMIFPG